MKTRVLIVAALALVAASQADAGFKGGVHVATGDVNGDGKAARGGVYVAAGDINGDGRADCTTAGERKIAAPGRAGSARMGSHAGGGGGGAGKVAVHDIAISKACEAAQADKSKPKTKPAGTFGPIGSGGGGGAGKPQ